ncbi:MAG: hypothetical protein MUE81_16100 [Thermoflexibacter sp.]|nr:hypothetical protein [Thermoflexibacter sp.]
MDISQLETLQKELAKKVIIPDKKDSYYPHDEDIIFSLDVQYVEEQAYIALDAQRWNGEHLGIFVSKQTTDLLNSRTFVDRWAWHSAPATVWCSFFGRSRSELAYGWLCERAIAKV